MLLVFLSASHLPVAAAAARAERLNNLLPLASKTRVFLCRSHETRETLRSRFAEFFELMSTSLSTNGVVKPQAQSSSSRSWISSVFDFIWNQVNLFRLPNVSTRQRPRCSGSKERRKFKKRGRMGRSLGSLFAFGIVRGFVLEKKRYLLPRYLTFSLSLSVTFYRSSKYLRNCAFIRHPSVVNIRTQICLSTSLSYASQSCVSHLAFISCDHEHAW